jgi:hypothetical protein
MTSPKQIAANRRNAQLSTGPKSRNGKERSRRNALLHSLTAETIIDVLEDPGHYKAFEAALVASYAPRSPVKRELTLRLASLFWRLRRATAIEAGLFQIQAEILQERHRLQGSGAPPASRTAEVVQRILAAAQGHLVQHDQGEANDSTAPLERNVTPATRVVARRKTAPTEMAQSFLRLANLNNSAFERIGRYEAALWKQAAQILLLLSRAPETGRWPASRRPECS